MKEFTEDALKFLDLTGANPRRRSENKILFTSLVFLLVTMGVALDLVFKWRGKASVETVTDLIGMWQVDSKVLILIINKNKFAHVLLLLGKFWATDKYGHTFQKKINSFNVVMKQIIRAFKATYLMLIVLYLGKPIFTWTKTLPVRSYFFSLDMAANPVFQITYALQLIYGILAFCTMVGFDMLFVSLIFYAVLELRIIKKGFSTISIDPINNANDDRSFRKFKVLVQHHGEILKFIKEVNNCYSLLLLNQFLISTFCVCAGLLVLNTYQLDQTATYVVYLISYLGQIFVFCAAGSYIVNESESIATALYNMPWWVKTQPQLRKAITFAIMRSNKEARLTGGGMLSLNLTSFTSIVNTSISFFTLARTLYSKSEKGV